MISRLDEHQRSLLRASVRIPQHVVYREFPAETVILNLQTETYHGLNPTAGQMLIALDGAATVEDAAAAIAGKYARPGDDVRADICDLCGELLERGLVERIEHA
jgi:hypothetical protein